MQNSRLIITSRREEITPTLSVQVHVNRGASSKVRKMHNLTFRQLSLPQLQYNLIDGDVSKHVCHKNVLILKLKVESVQVNSDIRE